MPKRVITPSDPYAEERMSRLLLWKQGGAARETFQGVGREYTGAPLRRTPTDDRLQLTWRTLADRRLPEWEHDAGRIIDPKSVSVKVSKAADYIGTYYGWNGTMRPEYDMLEPFVLFDTEAYLKQAVNRKLALMFRNGYEIVSEQNRLADYIKNRLDTMEYVMNRPVREFFISILYNLSLASNCFLLKIRDEKGSPGSKTEVNKNKVPVAGYTIVPSHTIFPYLEMGQIIKWRRIFDTGQPYVDYKLEDVIHLKWDVKPGHIFGTPRTVAVRDDIFALRRLEENIELLFMNFLFPLSHVKVGTAEAPCTYYDDGTSEVDLIRYQVQTMPKEGIFVTDERCDINVVGVEGKSLDTKDLIAHLKGRVYTGLGISPIDMGEGDTANRSTADNISQVLKDSIKADLDSFGNQIRMFIFKEWFMETKMSISIQGAVADTHLSFHEIDMDNKVKAETHAMGLYNSNLINHPEARKQMKMKPMEKADQKETNYEQHVKDLETHKVKVSVEGEKDLADHNAANEKELITHQTKEGGKQAATEMEVNKSEASLAHSKASAEHKSARAKVKVLHARTRHALAVGKTSPASKTNKTGKSTKNKTNPTNQHGSNTSPHRARSSQEFHELLRDRLLVAHHLSSDDREWAQLSSSAIEGLVQEFETIDSTADSYTRQIRPEIDRLKGLVALVYSDPEMLNVLLSNFTQDPDDEDIDGESEELLESDSPSQSGIPGAAGTDHAEPDHRGSAAGSDQEPDPAEAALQPDPTPGS